MFKLRLPVLHGLWTNQLPAPELSPPLPISIMTRMIL